MNKALVKEAEKYISMKPNLTKYDLVAFAEKQIAELKSDNDARKFAMAMSEKVEKQLREENAKLKTDYEVLSCSVGDFGELQDKLEEEQRKNNGLSDNLTTAKEIIKKLRALYLSPVVTKDDVKRQDEILNEAEQFLNGENIILEDAQAGNSPFDADKVFNKEMKAYPNEKVK